MKTIILIFSILTLCGCTEQIRAKKFGGNATVKLQSGYKIVTASWKQDDLWLLMRPAKTDERPETLIMQESSSWGLLQGTVTIQEQ